MGIKCWGIEVCRCRANKPVRPHDIIPEININEVTYSHYEAAYSMLSSQGPAFLL